MSDFVKKYAGLPHVTADRGPTAEIEALEVGRSVDGLEVVICHPDLYEAGVAVVLSPEQARRLARLLLQHASDAELAARLAREHAGPGQPR